MIYKKIIYLILVIIWMVSVFMFSNENGEKSEKTSSQVTRVIVKTITISDNLTEQEENKKVEEVDPIVRKLAHYTLYTIGGVIILNYINTFNITLKQKIILTIIIGILYATSDEIHQYFIQNRGSRITDIVIDTTGVLTGVSVYLRNKKNIYKKIKKYIKKY